MSSNTANCEINQPKGELIINGKKVVLRPKTFELLLLLASRSKEVVSKAEILATVWPNSVVEDQVVFQSINEIRKEIGLSEVIKTYPRRGYSWEVENTLVTDSDNQQANIVQNMQSALPVDSSEKTKGSQLILTGFGIVLALFALWFLFFSSLSPFPVKQSVEQSGFESTPIEQLSDVHQPEHHGLLVLPFNVDALDDSLKWLRFGAMEGLIKRLAPDEKITVFHLEDAIEILNRLPIQDRTNSDKIFQKSGASSILQASIAGVPGEYSLIYTIYSRNSRSTEALAVRDINDALSQLAAKFDVLSQNSGANDEYNFEQQFQSELLIKAIQFLETGDNKSALAFIESAVINDSGNLMAFYFFAKVTVELELFQRTLDVVEQAMKLTQHPEYSQYQPRLLYLKSAALLMLGEIDIAEAELESASAMAKASKDWLYYSYSQSMLGKINQFRGNHELALSLLNGALEYQELLHCPMGVAQGHLDLAEYYLIANDRETAQQYLSEAEGMIKERNLTQVNELLHHTKSLFEH